MELVRYLHYRNACLIFLAFLALFVTVSAQPVRLRSQITPSCPSSSQWKFADVWADGNLAVLGTYSCRGAFIFDISNPDAPSLASWYNPGDNQQFLEAIVIGTTAYFGSGNGGGVHVVDLNNPSAPSLVATINQTNGGGFSSIHEMLVFDQGGRRFLIENYNGFSDKRLRIIDVTNPSSAVLVREINPTDPQWVHAMHIRGSRLFTSGWGTSTSRGRTEIYDISNLSNQAPTLLGFIEDASASATAGNNMHSSWTSDDGRYLYSAREVTQSNGTSPGDVRVYDIQNPSQPLLVGRISMTDLGLNAITPHNPVVFGNKLYVSWYQAGVQVFDITQRNQLRRIGQYDAFPNTFRPETASQNIASEPWDLVCGTDNLQNLLPTTYDGTWAVFPLLGESKIIVGDMSSGLLILDATGAGMPQRNRISDFDGDRATDAAVYRPSQGLWINERSGGQSPEWYQFGISTDRPLVGDFDGDGRNDRAVFRPSTGVWYILGTTAGFYGFQYGLPGDIPVPADYDADGRDDAAVFRPSSGVWYIMQSTLGFKAVQWGTSGDIPMIGDFDGDGKSDYTVFRPSSGTWFQLQSSSSLWSSVQFGASGDKPQVGDIDGDGKADVVVYRPSNGTWWWIRSSDRAVGAIQFGITTDVPVMADYDADGYSDFAVYRPSTGIWYKLSGNNFTFSARQFGASNDFPVPAAVVGN